jgi:hypothetical protein
MNRLSSGSRRLHRLLLQSDPAFDEARTAAEYVLTCYLALRRAACPLASDRSVERVHPEATAALSSAPSNVSGLGRLDLVKHQLDRLVQILASDDMWLRELEKSPVPHHQPGRYHELAAL